MSKGRPVLEHDLPLPGSGGVVAVSVAGVPAGVNNADTVDGYHAAATPTSGRLLALDGSARFPTSVIDPTGLLHNSLGGLTVGNPHTQYVTGGGNGLSLASQVLSVVTGTGIKIDTGAVALDAHTHQTAAQGGTLDHGLALTGLADDDHGQYFRVAPPTTARNVVQAGAVDVTPLSLRAFSASQSAALWRVEDSGGNELIRVNQAGDLESAGFQSGIRGWRVDHGGTAEFHNAYVRGELHATVFVKDLIEAHAGTLGIFKSGGKLNVDFTIPAIGGTATLTVTDPPGGGFLFSANDWVRIKAEHSSGVYDVWGQVTAPVDNLDGTQRYTYTHRSGTVGAVIPAGVAVADYGASGQGYILATADLNYAPYLDVASWAGANPYTGSNHTAHVRLGQLQGITGVDEWGMWAGGTYPGLTGERYLKATDVGLTIYGLPQTWVNAAGNIRGQVLPNATGTDPLFWLGLSSAPADRRLTVQADGVVLFGGVPSTTLDGWRYGNTTTINGGAIQANTITAAQMAVVNANLVSDWSFEYQGRGWTLYPGASIGATGARTGLAGLAGDGNRANNYAYAEQRVPVQAGAVYYAEVWCYTGGTGSRETGMGITWRDAAGAIISAVYARGTPSGLTRYSVLATAPSNAAFADLWLAQWGTPNAAAPRWDDVVFRPASGANLVVGTPGSARVEINNTGLEGRDSSNTLQFRIRTSDGVGAFGPSGKESLISEGGLRLWGGETVWTDFSAIRWLAKPEITTAGRIASVGAGLYYGGTAPALQMVANPNEEYSTGLLALISRSSTLNEYAIMEMRSGPTYGGTWTMSGLHSGAVAWSMTADSAGYEMSLGGAIRAKLNTTGLRVLGRLGTGISADASYPLHIEKSDLYGIYMLHKAITANRAIAVTRRNSTDNGSLEWFQEVGTGDAPTWNFVRVNRPDGSGAQFLTALAIQWNGSVGVNTASPQQALHVNGVVRADTRYDVGTLLGATAEPTVITKATYSSGTWTFSTSTFKFAGGILYSYANNY